MGAMKTIIGILLLVVTMVAAIMPEGIHTARQTIAKDASYRLPKTAKPKSYAVNLRPEFENFTFQGDVNINVEILEEYTGYITLHSNELTITNIEITDENGSQLEPATFTHDYEKHFLTINKDNGFSAATEYNIHITFNGTLSEDMHGFYKSSYIIDGETKWLAATQFESTYARSAFPCFDEPEYKATFQITIETPPRYHSLSNMPTPVLIEDPESDDWFNYTFEATKEMSTYLVAFIVSDFESLKVEEDEYSFSAWARSNAIQKAEYSQSIGPKLVAFFEDYTGIKYEFPKIDQVAVPDFASGAMENWGLITYRETGLLYYEGLSTESNKKSTATVVAHELAHMWFGNLVTLKWWDYTWLNEGFARLFQYISTDKVETDWRLLEQFVVDQQHSVFALDALVSAQALTSESYTPAEVSAKFGTITYSKGGSVLRMLRFILTPDIFQEGLKNYLNANKWGNAVPQDLFDALEAQRLVDNIGNHPVKEFFEQWTTQPGYPVINITRENTKVTVTQERFLLIGTEDETEKLTWYVPLTWTTKSEAPTGFEVTKPSDWIIPGETSKELTIEANPEDWIIFNNQEAGYYRVNYDPESWQLIINGLQDDRESIHVLNRAQVLDDALNLARAGLLNYELALELTQYLTSEEDYIPWAAALNAFSFLDRRLTKDEGYEHFKKYMLDILANVYNTLGFEEKPTDTQVTLLHRVSVLTWACRLGLQDCVDNARNKYQEYQEDPENKPIPANLRSLVFCTALEHGEDNEWNFLWDRFQKSVITIEQVTILSALGCTKNEGLLAGYLDKSIDVTSGIRKQDAASVFSAVYSNPDGVATAFNFLKDKYLEISEAYGGMNAVANSITGIAGRLTTEQQVQELDDFINNAEDLGDAAEAGKNAVEAARADLKWTNIHKNAIIAWFIDQETTTDSSTPTTTPTTDSSTPTTDSSTLTTNSSTPTTDSSTLTTDSSTLTTDSSTPTTDSTPTTTSTITTSTTSVPTQSSTETTIETTPGGSGIIAINIVMIISAFLVVLFA